ncbi:MAG: hypothetical protein AB1515_02840 [Nitrospirota bacterium]
MRPSLCPRPVAALCSCFLALAGCASSITVGPAFQPLPALALTPTPSLQLEPDGFRYCYRDEPCDTDPALGARYGALLAERFPEPDPLASPVSTPPVRVVTEMRLVDDHQGRLFGYGLLFGPLAFLTPIPYPMALDFLTVSTTLDEEGRPIRVYRSRQLLEFWTYSAWGLRDPALIEAAMRHHLRALERSLQFDTALYLPPAPAAPTAEPETPADPAAASARAAK